MEEVIEGANVIANTVGFFYCLGAINMMGPRTHHGVRMAVIMMAAGTLLNALGTGHSWVLAVGVTAFFLFDRRYNAVSFNDNREHEGA